MAIEVNRATVVQWGRVVFHLDNAAFRKGFLYGRDYYDIDATTEEPQRATNLTVEADSSTRCKDRSLSL